MNRSPLKITLAMLQAGEEALDLARQASHTPRATAHTVFAAMLAASAWSPIARKRPKLYPSRVLTRADFNDDGLMFTDNGDGTRRIRHIYDCHHLRAAWKREIGSKK